MTKPDKRIGKYALFERRKKRGGVSFCVSWWTGRKHHSKVFASLDERSRWVADAIRGERDVEAVRAKAARAGDYVAIFSKLDVEAQNALLGAWEKIRLAGGTPQDMLAAADARAGDYVSLFSRLDGDTQHALLGAWEKIGGAGGGAAEILEAADAQAALMGGGISVGDAVAAHLEDVKVRLSASSRKERRMYLANLSAQYGESPLCSLSRGRCREWIDGASTSCTKQHRHAVLSAFLNECVRREWLRASPMQGFRKPRVQATENVAIFSPDEAERLLRAAERLAPSLVPFYALGLFAGLRPQREIRCLRREFIDLDGGVIYVTTTTAKTRIGRSVPVSGNLKEWLEAYSFEGTPKWSRRRHRAIVAEAKLEWKQDVMRHTCASFRLALTRDPTRTADEMGHGVDVLKRHYANRRIPPAEVEEYWNIMPVKQSGQE